MAVTIMSAKYSLFHKLGIDSTFLENAKIKMQLGFYDLKLVTETGQEVWAYKLPVSTNDIMKGTVPAPQLAVVKGTIEKAMEKVKSQLEPTVAAQTFTIEDDEGTKYEKPMSADLDKILKEAKAWTTGDVLSEALKTPIGTLAPAQVVKLERVSLKDATRLYQPVHGSSGGSKYFVVAIGQGVKIAARVLGDGVSIRAEGNLTPKVMGALAQVGVDKKDVSYASAHFKLTNGVTAERLIGAVLVGTGLEFETPIPKIDYFKALGA